MSAARILFEKLHGALKCSRKSARAGEQPAQDVVEKVAGRAGGSLSRELGATRLLRGVAEIPLEDRDEHARPDQALRDLALRSVEAVKIGVRLPLLEDELDLPAKPVQRGYFVPAKLRALQVGMQIKEGLRFAILCCVERDDAPIPAATAVASFDIEIDVFSRKNGKT